ncbi:ferritin-like domain-containing protein [Streptosporangium sp. DT93]|uniref:ferritin-like domain-containing protein n=1 Tax=Streptosporangium sp. DT93 TaxID=3393428 RepID=UPI003CF8783C
MRAVRAAEDAEGAEGTARTVRARGGADVRRAERGLDVALAAEHAAVYAYGVIAARTTGGLRATTTAAYNAHRARRDRLRAMIVAAGGRPVEPEASYRLPVTPSTAAQAVELAVLVERGVTGAYLELAASSDTSLRTMAALAMQECVTRSYGLRPEIEAFPGMPHGPGPASPATGATTGTPSGVPSGASPGATGGAPPDATPSAAPATSP